MSFTFSFLLSDLGAYEYSADFSGMQYDLALSVSDLKITRKGVPKELRSNHTEKSFERLSY